MSVDLVAQLLKRIDRATPEQLASIEAALDQAVPKQVWFPTIGAQKLAYESEADELFYGGSAGCGKTSLLVGLSLRAHKRSLVLRRTNKEASKLVESYVDLMGSRDGFNGQDSVWRTKDGRVIDIGGCQHEDDKQKWKGTPHDGIFFDEISDFTESIFRFIAAWNRSSDPGQRCRIVCAGNPPTTPAGLWVLQYWAPWLDNTHPNPAEPGELRWFTTIAGKDAEVDGPGPHLIDGELIKARSRTFIPGKLADNPFLSRTNYAATLAALPEEIRAAYKDGRFDKGLADDPKQVIKTDWIIAAQKRWREHPEAPRDAPMAAMGLDIAQGGADNTVLAWRHDWWYGPLVVKPGSETPTPSAAAGMIVTYRRDNALVVVDMGGGYGGGVLERLKENGVEVQAFNGANTGHGRTRDGKLAFVNARARAYWRFREALDPDQAGGSPICLPDDPALRADLAAPTWELTTRGIKIEEKDEIKKRLGRSPDRADAVVMAWADGQQGIAHRIMRSHSRDQQRPQFAKVSDAAEARRRYRTGGY